MPFDRLADAVNCLIYVARRLGGLIAISGAHDQRALSVQSHRGSPIELHLHLRYISARLKGYIIFEPIVLRAVVVDVDAIPDVLEGDVRAVGILTNSATGRGADELLANGIRLVQVDGGFGWDQRCLVVEANDVE